MKTEIYKAEERGSADHGWLKSNFSFSFAEYYDSNKMRFGLLWVLNDDEIAPGTGFGTHPHDNMEIITIVLEGTLEHKDNMGNASIIQPNEVQIMSAGTGITHSEYNHSGEKPVRLLQLWVFPKEKNISPRYEQKTFLPEERKNNLQIVVSPDKKDNAVWINQDAYFYLGSLGKDNSIDYSAKLKDNGAYIFVIDGSLRVGNVKLDKRDAVGISDFDRVALVAEEKTELLIVEVPMR